MAKYRPLLEEEDVPNACPTLLGSGEPYLGGKCTSPTVCLNPLSVKVAGGGTSGGFVVSDATWLAIPGLLSASSLEQQNCSYVHCLSACTLFRTGSHSLD